MKGGYVQMHSDFVKKLWHRRVATDGDLLVSQLLADMDRCSPCFLCMSSAVGNAYLLRLSQSRSRAKPCLLRFSALAQNTVKSHKDDEQDEYRVLPCVGHWLMHAARVHSSTAWS